MLKWAASSFHKLGGLLKRIKPTDNIWIVIDSIKPLGVNMDYYKNIEVYQKNPYGDRIIQYHLDGDTPEDICYSIYIRCDRDKNNEVEVAFTKDQLPEFERFLETLKKIR